MNEDRLEEIRFVFSNHTHDVGPQDVNWLISEVERLRIVADQLMFALGRHEATIATLRRPMDIARESQKCKNCVVGAFCARHDDLFWGAMREALATVQEE